MSLFFTKDKVGQIEFLDPITLGITFHLGFGVSVNQIVKLSRVEIKKEKYKEAIEAVKDFFKADFKIVPYHTGKQGRYLIDVFANNLNLSKYLLEQGLVTEFKARKK